MGVYAALTSRCAVASVCSAHVAAVLALVVDVDASGSGSSYPTRAVEYHDVTCRPAGAPRAALVYLHGGGFLVGGTDVWLREQCEPFASAGYVTTAVDYPIRELGADPPRFSYRRTLRQVIRAANALAEACLPVFAYGESAGGNIAEMLAVRDRIAGSVAVAAPSDLLTWATENREYWRLLGMTRRERRDASPLHRIGPRPRPLLMLHSPADEVVPIDQSRRLAETLSAARLIRLSGGHLADPDAMRIGLRWLRRRTEALTPSARDCTRAARSAGTKLTAPR
jgi:acetyl esterase/lipase